MGASHTKTGWSDIMVAKLGFCFYIFVFMTSVYETCGIFPACLAGTEERAPEWRNPEQGP